MLLLGFMFGWGGGMDSLKGIGKYFPFCLIYMPSTKTYICTNAWALKRERHDFILELYEKATLKLVEKRKRKIHI
jgi:hypothetical protein